jgi:hypothetical protein
VYLTPPPFIDFVDRRKKFKKICFNTFKVIRYILRHLESYSCKRRIKRTRGVIFTFFVITYLMWVVPYIIFNVVLASLMWKIRQYALYLKPCMIIRHVRLHVVSTRKTRPHRELNEMVQGPCAHLTLHERARGLTD